MFEVGDRVKVIRKVTEEEQYCWAPGMDSTVEKHGVVVKKIKDNPSFFLVAIDNKEYWYYKKCLELSKNSKINVLGTEYEIIIRDSEEDEKLKKCDGYVEFYSKKIIVEKQKQDLWCVENVEQYQRKVLKHEIIHAFMYESGLDVESDFARNEVLIDWLAIQIEKIYKVFENI